MYTLLDLQCYISTHCVHPYSLIPVETEGELLAFIHLSIHLSVHYCIYHENYLKNQYFTLTKCKGPSIQATFFHIHIDIESNI